MFALALIAALVWPPWQTVAQGSAPSDGKTNPPVAAAFVAGTPAATEAFTPFLRDEDATKMGAADFRHDVIVAAIREAPSPCHKLEIVGLRRVRQTLTVTVVLHQPPAGTGCLTTIGWPYHVIAVPRSVIGRPLPRHVIELFDTGLVSADPEEPSLPSLRNAALSNDGVRRLVVW